jgi:hypothetical protein
MIPVDNLGRLGMIFDRKSHELPPEAFSSIRNCRCSNGDLYSTFGYTQIMGTPLHAGYYLTSTVDVADQVLWAYAGTAKISATDGTTHSDITRLAGDYTGTDAALWNGGNFGGITILNNGVDVPQAWINPALATKLVNLANWPASTFAKVVRPLGRFLVALDVTVSGVRKSQLVKWSDEADIGSVPSTWDPTDATKKAGEWPLLETEGPCIDLLPLGERGIIYKSDSIHTMTRTAGVFVWAFKKVFNVGLLGQRCAAEWEGKHICATQDDVVIHDGFQMTSLINEKMRNWFAGRVDLTNAFRSYLGFNYAENEVWVCVPESGQKYPNVALIINMKDGTCVVQDLPGYAHVDWGRPPGASQTYDSFTIPFDSMVGYFGQSTANAARKRMIGISPDAVKIFLLDSGFTANGTPFTSRAERLGLAVVGQTRSGEPKSDFTVKKLVTEIMPKLTMVSGTSVKFYVGMQERIDGAVLWKGPFVFTPSAALNFFPDIEGRLAAVAIETTDGSAWRWDGYDMDLKMIGKY